MPGVISAGDQATAGAGASILRIGGNAVDAAVAAAFVSFIAEVGVVHLGGSGMAQVFKPGSVKGRFDAVAYDFFSNMPGIGTEIDLDKLDFKKVTIDFGPTTQDFHLGRGSVAVPGNIAGLCKMAADHGRLTITQLLQPAITLARDGHRIAPFQAETCDLLSPIYTNTADMRAIFAKNGRIIRPDERLFIPDLAQSLETLAIYGSEFAQSGKLGQAMLADQEANGGLLNPTDLATYRVRKHTPIRLPYREYEILLPPLSSSGGVLTAFTFKLLSQFDVSDYQHSSVEHLRLLHEIMAATTRARPVWDRLIRDLPPEEATQYFLADSFVNHYVHEVRSAIQGESRFPTLSEPSLHSNTSHISVIDSEGLSVSLTTTAGESAGYVVPGTGYIPNNILGEEDLHPGGFHSRPAGQRIPTMMTPAIILHQGKVRLVVGSGGSIRIRSAILQVLSNLLDFKMTLKAAVEAPRVHLEDGVFQCEWGYDSNAVDNLESIGYVVNRWDKRSIYFGGAHSVSRTKAGKLVAAGDSRRGGAVAVVD